MTVCPLVPGGLIDWATAGRPLPGEAVSGDLHLVASFDGGALVAVVDGLGHGPEAAAAAKTAVEALSCLPGAPVLQLLDLCHEHLKPTRGAVMSLASFDSRTNIMSWAGIGDVEGIVTSAAGPRQSIVLRNGVVGYRLPPLRCTDLPVAPGDTLIFATDGVRSDFRATAASGRQPQGIADDILLRHGKFTDDALVLVVRYLGTAS